MRIARFIHNGKRSYGIIDGTTIRCLKSSPFTRSNKIDKTQLSDDIINLKDVRLLAPCTPSKIVCLALNYRSHAEEFKLNILP